MKIKTGDARFLSDLLTLPMALRQRLALAANDHDELSIDDIDQLLELSRLKLDEIRFDDEGRATDAGRWLEKLIDDLKYS